MRMTRQATAVVAILFFAGTLALVSSSSAAAPGFRTGAYQGKTSDVYLDLNNKIVHQKSVVSLLLENVPLSSCGGHSSKTVTCLTNGGGGNGFGQWDTIDVNGGESICAAKGDSGFPSPINAGWILMEPVPASGVVNINLITPGDSGHVIAKIVVHKGSITGSVKQFVNVSTATTKGKMEPLCTTGTWTFDAKFLG